MVRAEVDPIAFKDLVDTLLKRDSPMVRALMANDINTHRKLKGRLKSGNISDLEYKDPNDSSKSIKLTDDEAIEIVAIHPFLDFRQNILGPKDTIKLDRYALTRDDFESYLEDFDEHHPDEYDRDLALKNLRERKRHEKEMSELASSTAAVMTSTNPSLESNSSSGNTGQNTDPVDEQLRALRKTTIKPDASKFQEFTK